jgi:uncharacterized protein (DUF2147 family)
MKGFLWGHAGLAFTVALTLASSLPAFARAGIVGTWWSPKHDGKILITTDASGKASGTVIAAADADRKDIRNPNPALRGRRLLGLVILSGFHDDGHGTWTGGSVYQPSSGRTFNADLKLKDDDHLLLHGFLGVGFLGDTKMLDRVQGPRPREAQPGEPALVYAGH